MSLNKVTGILKYTLRDINLRICLTGGQSFRWNEVNTNENQTELIGVIEDKIFILNQTQNSILYSTYSTTKNDCETSQILSDYLRLDVDLSSLYDQWSKIDPIFQQKLSLNPNLHGVRVLNQDIIENLFSFICSSNNNIKRIRKMIKALTENFGILIGNVNGTDYFTFPTIDRLAESDIEQKLRKLNFGYRAKFIQQAAVYLKKRFKNFNELYELRTKSYSEIFNELVNVPGIGNKIADCICLMSFSQFQSVPIDTHMLNVALNTYNFEVSGKKTKNISKKDYFIIGKSILQANPNDPSRSVLFL
jgi:N-glycosylase/DNA lyase